MRRSGLPEPGVQITIYAPDGTFIGRADLGYPELGVLIEFDGLIKYSKLLKPGERAPDVVLAEKLREDRLRDLGYLVVRLVWSELADPDGRCSEDHYQTRAGSQDRRGRGDQRNLDRRTGGADPALQCLNRVVTTSRVS